MGWIAEGDEKIYVPEYRIEEIYGGFEPQMRYEVRGVERWYALLESGFMADSNVWAPGSSGESFVRVLLPTRAMAERSILRAKIENGQINPVVSV